MAASFTFTYSSLESKSFWGGLTYSMLNKNKENERNFFGPIDINRLSVKLTDDKGTVINLNGNDWSFSLVTKHIYQRNT